MELRQYQKNIINSVYETIDLGVTRILVVAPTGSGKTLIASTIAKQELEKGKTVLWFCDRRKLVYQSYLVLDKITEVTPSFIMAGERFEESKLYVASIATFKRRLEQFQSLLKNKQLTIIFDEAHKCTKDQMKLIASIHTEIVFIGLTATPCNESGYGLGNIYEHIVQECTIKELTDNKYLVPACVYAPSVPDMKGVHLKQGDYDQEEAGKRMIPLIGDIIEHWLSYCHEGKTMVFCSSIAQSRYLVHQFTSTGVKAEHIDCYMEEWEKENALKRLESGEISILSNVVLLSYGLDIPAVDCIILARPTKSYVLYLQIIGRGLRPAPNKDKVLVLDHSGSVYMHGLPEDVPEWTLSTHIKIDKLRKQEEEQQGEKKEKLFTCLDCVSVFKGRVCPSCGHTVKPQEEAILIKQGRLQPVKVKPEVSFNQLTEEEFFSQLLAYSISKNYKKGWAYFKFKEKFNSEPPRDVKPAAVVSSAIPKFIKYLWLKQNRFAPRKYR